MCTPSTNHYKRHRFPAEIISYGVWLYFRFSLSYRDVEEFLRVRGIIVTYETIRQWCRKFGQAYANQLRHRLPRPGDEWYLGEVFLTARGTRHYLWRAVDQDGHVLDILVQRRPDTRRGSSPPMIRLHNTSTRDDIGGLPLTTVKKCGTDSTPGRNSRPYSPQHKSQDWRPSRLLLPGDHVDLQ
jgi:hypothetical protein